MYITSLTTSSIKRHSKEVISTKSACTFRQSQQGRSPEVIWHCTNAPASLRMDRFVQHPAVNMDIHRVYQGQAVTHLLQPLAIRPDAQLALQCGRCSHFRFSGSSWRRWSEGCTKVSFFSRAPALLATREDAPLSAEWRRRVLRGDAHGGGRRARAAAPATRAHIPGR